MFCRTRVYPMHWSKPEFAHHWNPISISGFIHHCIQSRHCWISSVRGIWYWPVEKCGDQSRKAAKIRFRIPLKLANYFRFVSQKKQASMLACVWAACKIWCKLVKNCGCNTWNCTSLKFDFISGFIHHWIQSRHCWILFVHGTWCWSVEKCGHQSLKTAEIGIRAPLKSLNYFRFVWQTIGVEATEQNFVKIGKELWGRNHSTTNLFTNTQTDGKNWLEGLCNALDRQSVFTACHNARTASEVLATAIPSVCPSVRLSHAGIVSKWLHVARCSLHCQIAKCV